jgi:hypothetical protein
MIISSSIAALAGALLGLYFRALVLAPAILIAAAVITVIGVAKGEGVEALPVIVVVASVQVSYLTGCILRAAVAATRASARDKIMLPTSRP